jgi:RNA polymerase sigma-54 factor
MKYGTFNLSEEIKNLTIRILQDNFEYISNNQHEKLIKKMGISRETLEQILSVIKHLSSRPLDALLRSEESMSQITPDFTITIEDDLLVLQLNSSQRLPKIRISKEYEEQYNYYAKKENREQKEQEIARFIRENVDKANYFISTLTLRETMLYNTMYAIMQHQHAYFYTGDERDLKPMILKNIADKVGLDVSTISRISNSKYVQTHFGIIPLKQLFSESVGDSDISAKEIQSVLKEIIQSEDKKNPLSDQELETALSERGYKIARRTVAKYREQLRILPARQRKIDY